MYGQVSPVTGTRVEVCARLVGEDNLVSSDQSEALNLTINQSEDLIATIEITQRTSL